MGLHPINHGTNCRLCQLHTKSSGVGVLDALENNRICSHLWMTVTMLVWDYVCGTGSRMPQVPGTQKVVVQISDSHLAIAVSVQASEVKTFGSASPYERWGFWNYEL